MRRTSHGSSAGHGSIRWIPTGARRSTDRGRVHAAVTSAFGPAGRTSDSSCAAGDGYTRCCVDPAITGEHSEERDRHRSVAGSQ